jgi:acetyltransferase-like isoleucine patch superfamily enzyme
VPPDVVVAGNPARVVRSLRDEPEALVLPLTKAVSHG